MGLGVESSAPGIVLAAVLGLIFGSFISALTWRLPREQKVSEGRSCCPQCGSALGVRDLVPVLSWLSSRGRCRHCSNSVSFRYPAIELSTAVVFAGIAWRAPSPEAALALMVLAVVLIALAVVDLEHGLLPDVLQLAAVLPALAVRWLGDGAEGLVAGLLTAVVAVLAALVLRIVFRLVRGRDGLGMGDVKFLGIAGLLLLPEAWPLFLFMAGTGGIAFGLAWRWLGRGPAFPFGPALIGALLILLLFPEFSFPF